MRGEQSVLNNIILNHPENPIKEPINNISPLRIIEVIEDEYWNEFRRRLEYSTCPSIYLSKLGRVVLQYSPLKGYIRKLIIQIRKVRKRIAILKESPKFDENNSMTIEIEKALVLKLRAAWQQLDQLRITRIMRIIKWNEKQKFLGTPEKIKRPYELLTWSFSEQLLNNIKFTDKPK